MYFYELPIVLQLSILVIHTVKPEAIRCNAHFIYILLGDPPSDAKEFMNFISTTNGTGPSLKHIQYSVLALGDSYYPHYCETGRTLDETLVEMNNCICSCK